VKSKIIFSPKRGFLRDTQELFRRIFVEKTVPISEDLYFNLAERTGLVRIKNDGMIKATSKRIV